MAEVVTIVILIAFVALLVFVGSGGTEGDRKREAYKERKRRLTRGNRRH